MNIGIYEIKNRANGKRYIGESLNVSRRWQQHKSDLRKGKHHCERLQKDFKHYPEIIFKYRMRERFWFTKGKFVNHDKLILTLLLREGYHMDKTNSILSYNTDDTLAALKMFADTGNNKRFARYKKYRRWIRRHISYGCKWKLHIMVASLYNPVIRYLLYILLGVMAWAICYYLLPTSVLEWVVTNFTNIFNIVRAA